MPVGSVSWLWLGRARVRSPLTAIFHKNFILEKANNVTLVRVWQGSTGMSILQPLRAEEKEIEIRILNANYGSFCGVPQSTAAFIGLTCEGVGRI